MTRYHTNWIELTKESAIKETTGGQMDYRKWVEEPNAIGRWMRGRIPASSSVCDFGCGAGRVSGVLKCYFPEVISTDLHPNIVECSDYPLKIIPYGQPFQVWGVLSCYVMQHIPPELFPEHLRVLRLSSWSHLFLLECRGDFSAEFDFRAGLKEFSTLVDDHPWPYERVTAEIYVRTSL